MYTEWETAIAFNRKCCSSWNVLFLRWQMPRFQPTSHTHSRSLSVNVCACVCWAVQCCYCCRRCRCRRRCCCCFPYQNRSFKCVFTCIVGRLLCLRLFDVLQTGEVNALAQSKSTVENLKPVCRWEGESKRRNSTNQNKTIHATCHVTRHTAMLVWVRTEFSFRSELPSQRRLQSIFENQRKKLQWLWTELTALEKLCNFILQA